MTLERTVVTLFWSAFEKGIIGDILTRLRIRPETRDLDIIAADVYHLRHPLVNDLVKAARDFPATHSDAFNRKFGEWLKDPENYNRYDISGKRAMSIVLEGENAVERVRNVVGTIEDALVGKRGSNTILGTHGVYRVAKDGSVRHIEYPLFAPHSKEEADRLIDLFWKKHKRYGGPLYNLTRGPSRKKGSIQRTVVLIKPNAFKPGDPRAGNVIEALETCTQDDVYLIGCKVFGNHCPDSPEGEEYRRRLEAFYSVHKDRPFFKELVDFMVSQPFLALVYEGPQARESIRSTALDVIRRAYVDTITQNTIHSSDSGRAYIKEIAALEYLRNNTLPAERN